jgi:hypothetical protein
LLAQVAHFVYTLISSDLYTPLGFAGALIFSFSGEFGLSPPLYIEAACLSAGVRLIHGSAAGLLFIPIAMTGSMLGAASTLWVLKKGVRFLPKWIKEPKSPTIVWLARRLSTASPFTLALLRELPGTQVTVTTLWAITHGSRAALMKAVALSAVLYGSALVIVGAISGGIFYGDQAAAFSWGMLGAVIATLALLLASWSVERRQSVAAAVTKEVAGPVTRL